MSNPKYISDLTRELINSNGFEEVCRRSSSERKFMAHVRITLECGALKEMTHETLGKIMGSFLKGDVQATHRELFKHVKYNGDCSEMHRALVAACLTFKIRDVVKSDIKKKESQGGFTFW